MYLGGGGEKPRRKVLLENIAVGAIGGEVIT